MGSLPHQDRLGAGAFQFGTSSRPERERSIVDVPAHSRKVTSSLTSRTSTRPRLELDPGPLAKTTRPGTLVAAILLDYPAHDFVAANVQEPADFNFGVGSLA